MKISILEGNVDSKHTWLDLMQLTIQSYQLGNTETSEGFASMASIVSANKDEEVWLDLEA